MTLESTAVMHDESWFPVKMEVIELFQHLFYLFMDASVVMFLHSFDKVVSWVGTESTGEELVEFQQVDASTLKITTYYHQEIENYLK